MTRFPYRLTMASETPSCNQTIATQHRMWKLALALQIAKEDRPEIAAPFLDFYEEERRSVVESCIETSLISYHITTTVPAAIGLEPGARTWEQYFPIPKRRWPCGPLSSISDRSTKGDFWKNQRNLKQTAAVRPVSTPS